MDLFYIIGLCELDLMRFTAIKTADAVKTETSHVCIRQSVQCPSSRRVQFTCETN